MWNGPVTLFCLWHLIGCSALPSYIAVGSSRSSSSSSISAANKEELDINNNWSQRIGLKFSNFLE